MYGLGCRHEPYGRRKCKSFQFTTQKVGVMVNAEHVAMSSVINVFRSKITTQVDNWNTPLQKVSCSARPNTSRGGGCCGIVDVVAKNIKIFIIIHSHLHRICMPLSCTQSRKIHYPARLLSSNTLNTTAHSPVICPLDRRDYLQSTIPLYSA